MSVPFVIYKCDVLSICAVEWDEGWTRDPTAMIDRSTGLRKFRGSGENQLKGYAQNKRRHKSGYGQAYNDGYNIMEVILLLRLLLSISVYVFL